MSEETILTAARRVVRFARGDDHQHGGLLSLDTIQAVETLAQQIEAEEKREKRARAVAEARAHELTTTGGDA
jgi:hypothetical protein